MIYEIEPGIFWDTEKQHFEQSIEADEIYNNTLMFVQPVNEFEPALNGERLLYHRYHINASFAFQVKTNYINPADSTEWGAVSNYEISLITL